MPCGWRLSGGALLRWGDRERGRQRDKETRRGGEGETGRKGDREKRKKRDKGTRRGGDWEIVQYCLHERGLTCLYMEKQI